jgi:hypothetical protein
VEITATIEQTADENSFGEDPNDLELLPGANASCLCVILYRCAF